MIEEKAEDKEEEPKPHVQSTLLNMFNKKPEATESKMQGNILDFLPDQNKAAVNQDSGSESSELNQR